MKISTIFFGASEYVLPIIEFLNEKYEVKLVVTTETKPTDAVPKFCRKNNIPFISLKSFHDTLWQHHWKAEIEKWKLDFSVLADFGLLIPQAVLDMFPKGIVNIHPSLLPQYRGPTPGASAILDGKTTTGVSLMLLDKDLDHGPILGHIEEKIKPDDTSQTLYSRLFEKGVQLLKTLLPDYLDGKIKPKEQNHANATYTEFLTRKSGYISLHKGDKKELPVNQLDRMIRAYFPWPGVWTKWHINGKEKIVKFLPNNMIQMEGKKPTNYNDFINGYSEGKEFLEKLELMLLMFFVFVIL